MKIYTKNKKIITISAIIVIVLAVTSAYLFIASQAKIWPFISELSTSQTPGEVNYNPPTTIEEQQSQDGKENSKDKPENTTGSVAVDVSYVGKSSDRNYIEIRAFTADVIEGTGTCTATFTKGSTTISESSKAFIDARSSICEPIFIPVTSFSELGPWNLTVQYISPAFSGSIAQEAALSL